MTRDTKDFWEDYSSTYQEGTQIPVDIHYGPGCPNEAELNLLGEVAGRDVLEIGCGGGQCSVAFALRGARVTSLDLSDEQLKFAGELAAENGVALSLLRHDMRDLAPIAAASQDIVFSAFAFQWVEDRLAAFREVARVLRPGGTFALSLDHPFFRKVDPETLRLKESYNESGKVTERRGDFGEVTLYRTNIAELHQALVGAGLRVVQIVEPDSRIRYPYDPWFGRREAYVPELLDMVPPTIVFKAVKDPVSERP